MGTAAMAHDEVVMPRREMLVRGLASKWSASWTDADADWYKCIPCKNVENQEGAARLMLVFARAYLVALVSAQDDPVFDQGSDDSRSTPVKILDDIQKSKNGKGEVSMGSIVASFAKCPGQVFCETLTLLSWAGHIGSFNTLAMYRYTVSTVVDAYLEGQRMIVRKTPSEEQVWSRCPFRACCSFGLHAPQCSMGTKILTVLQQIAQRTGVCSV